MAKRFEATLTIKLPDDVFETAERMVAIREAINNIREQLPSLKLGDDQYSFVTHVVGSRNETKPRAKRGSSQTITETSAEHSTEATAETDAEMQASDDQEFSPDHSSASSEVSSTNESTNPRSKHGLNAAAGA